MTFKIGDKVIVTKDFCQDDLNLKKGWPGIIKSMNEGNWVGVNWGSLLHDSPYGHNLEGAIHTDTGWEINVKHFYLREIKIIENSQFELPFGENNEI
jgi:hypothetical protein